MLRSWTHANRRKSPRTEVTHVEMTNSVGISNIANAHPNTRSIRIDEEAGLPCGKTHIIVAATWRAVPLRRICAALHRCGEFSPKKHVKCCINRRTVERPSRNRLRQKQKLRKHPELS